MTYPSRRMSRSSLSRKRVASSVLTGSLITAIVVALSIIAGEGVGDGISSQLAQSRLQATSSSIQSSLVKSGTNTLVFSCSSSPGNVVLFNEGGSGTMVVSISVTFAGNTLVGYASNKCQIGAGGTLGISFDVFQTSGTLPFPGLAYDGYVQSSAGATALFTGAFQ